MNKWKNYKNKFLEMKKTTRVFLGVGLCVFIIFFSFAKYVYSKALDIKVREMKVNETSIIYDRTGQHKLYEMHGEEDRKVIEHDEIPDYVRWATLATEDSNFYSHPGFDIKGIIRALVSNIGSNSLSQGGSTITQQLARNAYLTREKSWNRKIKEIIIAIKIERAYSKDQILDAYLNEIPYGSNAYGIQSAAETFFGKDARDLSLDEAALLAALPKAPTDYSPYGKLKQELRFRQKSIIREMEKLGYISREQEREALSENTLAKIKPYSKEIDCPHFVFYVIDQLEKKYGRDFLEKGGLRIYTTLDYDLQKNAERIIREGALNNQVKNNASNASLVSLDVKNGDILVMVGSRDFFDESIDGEVNVTTSPRQPGSSFKPIVYAKAFEKGYQPESLLFDVWTDFGPDGSGKNYIPQNYNGGFNGLVSMRKALAGSLNIPAIKTIYLAGISETVDIARRLGINSLNDPRNYGLALAIGGGDITLLEETNAFATFANDGTRVSPRAVYRMIDSQGKAYNEFEPEKKKVLDEEVARKINSILSDNNSRAFTFGINNPLTLPRKTVAAKTGTTQDFRDAWTVGYTPSIATGVWVGNNDFSPMKFGSDGVFVAAPIWNKFMQYALRNKANEEFIEYQKIKSENPMVTGKMKGEVSYFNNKTGKKISEDKMKKTDPDKIEQRIEGGGHEIIYYVNKDFPLSSLPPDRNDPMLLRWDSSLGSASIQIKDFEFLKYLDGSLYGVESISNSSQ